MNLSDSRDVHQYDGQWNVEFTQIDKQQRITLFNDLISRIRTLGIDNIDGVLLVMRDSQTDNNYDPIHKVYADDILAHICQRELTDSLLFVLLEQMNDMYTTGRCPQGRTTRLFQVWTSMN